MSKKPPLVELPSQRVTVSLKFKKETAARIKRVRTSAKKLGATLNIDEHIDANTNEYLDLIEIRLSDIGHDIDDRLTAKKEDKKTAAAKRRKTPPPLPTQPRLIEE